VVIPPEPPVEEPPAEEPPAKAPPALEPTWTPTTTLTATLTLTPLVPLKEAPAPIEPGLPEDPTS
jgi:hypothetical protein